MSKIFDYETYIPRKFTLDDGRTIILSQNLLETSKEPLFYLYVPPNKIDEVYMHLKKVGFKDAKLAAPEKEKYSIRYVFRRPWELHVRLFPDGFIKAEVEVQREFLEHLKDYRVFVVFEPYVFYREIYDKLHIFYKPENRWVVDIKDYYKVTLKPPNKLTPWKPIIAGVTLVGVLGAILLTLKKQKRIA